MNTLFSALGVAAWKPVLGALLLPPAPLLLLILVGGWLLLQRRRVTGWLLVLAGTTAVWLSACSGVADLLTSALLHPPPALGSAQINRLRSEVAARKRLTIVVLGGGRDTLAPEYGTANLTPHALERLRYGVWLARETGATLGFSGGVGWGDAPGPPEAEVAARIAASQLGLPLTWTEDQSRDTRENAVRSVALLERAGIERVVLVTHGWHMQRARRLFEAAAAGKIEFVAAPMGLAPLAIGSALDWLPSAEGFERVRAVAHECLGRLAGD